MASDYAFAPKSVGKSPPYDPKGVAADLESQYPGQVSSSTLPPPGSKNVGLAGARHPSGVVFDQRGFPIFDDVAAFDTKLSGSVAGVKSRPLHFMEAARALSDAIRRGQVPASRFTAEQLRAIHRYQKKIPGLSWHHHQQVGRMQLIPTPLHQAVGHTGGFALWFE
jgi:filamentous hemagglutinin